MGDFETNGVLKGLKVLDFTIALSGAFVAWQFADLGAEVWKVEKYGEGDQARTWAPFVNGLSTLFASYNKNKQSIEMNLAKPEGKAIIYEMVKHCDVVLENFKSGSIDRLGLGYEKLKEINPRIVFVSLSGFGASGPMMKYPCYDAIAAARGGFAGSNGEPDGAPMKAGNSICDTLAGIYTLNAALMALIDARRTGKGCRVDVAMADVAMRSCEETLMDYAKYGSTQSRFGNHDRFIAPYGIFEARDGFAVIIADTQERFRKLCEALEIPQLIDNPLFADNASRIKNKDALVAEIEAVTRTLFRSQIEEKLLSQGVPASAILTFIEAYTSKHSNETGVTEFVQQDKIGAVRFYKNPIRFNNTPCEIKRGSPLLGQDTDSIMRELGYSDEEIKELYDAEVIGSHMI